MNDMLRVENVAKSFTLHLQGGIELAVLENVSLSVSAGECVALAGDSGSGKSTLMRMIYGNYRCDEGAIRVRHGDAWVDLAKADPWTITEVRRRTLGYVSQFLRVIPRVPTLEIVAEPAMARGVGRDEALDRARQLLERLRVPERLWSLPPATFSGGEQQRINVARGFIARFPVMLLDEPTASLDAANRATVLELIEEAKSAGAAVVGIFHDADARTQVADRSFAVAARAGAGAA
ncbi:phosphonate C-P lyase system protein PhnL [Minwuia thermotolerans]|uniref:Phosphonate C-P lyase system protein PhnL n=1 Tax=Minwuia thermotolerans TaxID=2056226 RepID=A0A2M9G3F7_9PROT|nr:phosphonate C-P lyase system protein PhnL [Minwuia thermotolerans]PJK30243.1 phosphonate C-P lyase system protein PhnL [Minwuia thermotolerans]